MAVKQEDVARAAGVSRKTVSNVINGYQHVSLDVRTRVEAAILELGYRPNSAARSLRSGRSPVIGLVIPEIDVSYFPELSRRVIEAAEGLGLTVTVLQTLGDPQREEAALEGEAVPFVDGIILSSIAIDPRDLIQRRNGPSVVLVGEPSGLGGFSHVGIDNTASAHEATRHLIEIGRRRIAFIGQSPRTLTMAELRARGYRAALAEAGIAVDPDLVATTDGYHRTHGMAAANRLLDLPEPPDAVFCATDLLALGALRAFHERSLRVPADIAVVGFDDIEEGRYAIPSLSTISPDKAAIARIAVERLARLIEHGPDAVPAEDLLVAARLVVRESTAL